MNRIAWSLMLVGNSMVDRRFTVYFSDGMVRSCMVILISSYVTLFHGFDLIGQESDSEVLEFYASADRQKVVIRTMADWELHKWKMRESMQAVMGPLPSPARSSPFDVRITDTLDTDKYQRLTIQFNPVANERVHAYLYIPKRTGVLGVLPAMIALHPTGKIGKKIVDGQGKANRGYAKELAKRGYVVIAPDYPSFGDLTGYDFDHDRYQSGSMAAIFYHMCCIDLLCARPEVDPQRIGVIGHSLGGHNALFLAAFDHRVKVVVTSCGWTQFEYYDVGPSAIDRYGGRLGPWAQDRYMPLIREKYKLNGDLLPFNFHEVIGLIAPRPCFTNAPLQDANFDVEGVRVGIEKAHAVYRFLQSPDNLLVRYPVAEHDFPDEVRLEAYQFIDKNFNYVPSAHDLE